MCIPLAVSFSGTLATTKAQLNSTSGMPPLGQPSFCLKVTSSLVLFLFTTQDDLTVKRHVCTQPCFSCSLYGSLSVLNAVLPFSLVIPLITYILATGATLAVATAPQLHTGWNQLTNAVMKPGVCLKHWFVQHNELYECG